MVLSKSAFNQIPLINTCSNKPITMFNTVPVIDLSDPNSKELVVKICKDFGFFKVVNHGVPMEYITRLEALALSFFNSPQSEKDKASPPDPFGYGSKRIGQNGDMGWIEYMFFYPIPEAISLKSLSGFSSNPEIFWRAVSDYVGAVKEVACKVVEMVAEGLRIEPKNEMSKLLRDEKSDSCFRVNHYPPCPELQASSGQNLVGFGEHTDPQIVSVLRSNNTSGLQICLRDGTWVSVPPDPDNFFVIAGDALQVMTNGRFKSVKHRVLPDHSKSRISMVYFGAPPLDKKIVALASMVGEGEERLYKEFTWLEYKMSAKNSKLGDNRLELFENVKPRER